MKQSCVLVCSLMVLAVPRPAFGQDPSSRFRMGLDQMREAVKIVFTLTPRHPTFDGPAGGMGQPLGAVGFMTPTSVSRYSPPYNPTGWARFEASQEVEGVAIHLAAEENQPFVLDLKVETDRQTIFKLRTNNCSLNYRLPGQVSTHGVVQDFNVPQGVHHLVATVENTEGAGGGAGSYAVCFYTLQAQPALAGDWENAPIWQFFSAQLRKP
jgi:hypothetical protein